MSSVEELIVVTDESSKASSSGQAKRPRDESGRPSNRIMNHYFVVGDVVWVRPERHPYWPAEVESINDKTNTVTCTLICPPEMLRHAASGDDATTHDAKEVVVRVTASVKKVFYFDHVEDKTQIMEMVESRLQRAQHDVSCYETAFVEAVRVANEIVRIVMDPKLQKPFSVCGIGVVRSFMRSHTEAPRQPQTKDFAPQTAVIVLRPGLENAVRDLQGFERIWILFHFSYSVGLHPDRAGNENTCGWKTMIVPPRDTELRGVFATRSPHRPNSIGLSCVRLVRVQGLEVHISDHDLLHGTPVLDIKPYLPFCDAHPQAKAGWVEALDARSAGGADHRSNNNQFVVHRNLATPLASGGTLSASSGSGKPVVQKLTKHA
jgi:tRNA-Thr(GGU) m(6)t(6)A37 methyltransferase TsaA